MMETKLLPLRALLFQKAKQILSSFQYSVMFLRDSDGHTALFFRSATNVGRIQYRGFYLGVWSYIDWCNESSQWHLSVMNRGEKIIVFYSETTGSALPPTSQDYAWKSRYSECRVAKLGFFRDIVFSDGNLKTA